jgi:hypothetical protein
MLRRHSGRWAIGLALSVGILFVPLAAASNADNAIRTLALLSLVFGLLALEATWLVVRFGRRRNARAILLGVAAFVGTLFASLVFDSVGDFAGLSRGPLAGRLLVSALANGAGCWLFVACARRVFPRRNRPMAVAAIALVAVGIFPGPALLLQPSVATMNLANVELQLTAAQMYWTVGAILLVGPFLALLTVPGDWFDRWFDELAGNAMAIPDRLFVTGASLLAFGLATFFAIYSFDRRPTTADEIAQLWHAKMLLEGRLAMPPDPNLEFFAIDNVIDTPRWMSQFPIGGPAFLAIGLLLRAEWLLNAVLCGLIVASAYWFTRRVYFEAQARAAALVVALSPMLLIMGGTQMNHPPTAFLAMLALAALALWIQSPSRRPLAAAIIGASVGLAITIRPLDGAVLGLIHGLVMLAACARDRSRVRSVLVGAAAGAIPVLLLMLVNWRTTGHPLHFGYEVLWGPNHSLGLHDDPTGNPHTAWRALLLAVKYTMQMSWIASSWPVPIMVIVAAGLAFALRPNRWDVLLLVLFVAQVAVYAFYWHDGQFAGPRFLYTALPAFLILAARMPFLVAPRARGTVRRVAIAIIPVCIGVSWLRSMQPFGVQGLAREFRESRSRLKIDPPLEVSSGAVRNALIFVQEGAAARLQHRLWGVGVSRKDAARLIRYSDHCSLLDAVISEEQRGSADSVGRLARIERAAQPFVESARNGVFPDRNFKVSDASRMTLECIAEVAHDNRVKNTIAYGSMLLQNEFDDEGRIGGAAVYVMDLRNHNEVLRARFGGRQWYRFEVPRDRPDSNAVLVPYAPADSAARSVPK